ncbi:hypothetical protein B0T18DRAFT_401848 [Schizothecium vesticola]|uniref:NOT2/NOT3/NOT5 C-terminal domain-containing protein n=1 Tax=Schizothecium vesticola TaxID=314040 RepID=A0AA40K9M4_9PEZI|nr:hypothetical protein B0T18DRAFT_401848 [Schizothecium vesticola]
MMNRSGTGPLRGMQGGFGGQQQPPSSGRAVSNRIPNGKMAASQAGNGAGWSSYHGMQGMGGANSVTQGSARLGGNATFAQSVSGSQSQASLDPSEFPQLTNSSQLGTPGQANMWSGAGSRNLPGGASRGSGTPLPQQEQQDGYFGGALGQATGAQSSQAQSSADEFPPLSNRTNGEMVNQDRMGFGGQGTAPPLSNARTGGNGLLNALSANTRAAEGRGPSAIQRPHDLRSPVGEEEPRKPPGYREDSLASHASSVGDGPSSSRNPLGAIGAVGNDTAMGKQKEEDKGRAVEVQDPLEGMSAADRFGLKGLRLLMNNCADYNALTVGIDATNLGFNLSAPDTISDKIYSLYNHEPPRPAVESFHIPDCYSVTNVEPIEKKMQSFNEETLMWIFYSCPGDRKQQMAAMELTNRNWRWHKKLQIWLTKDEMMVPQALSQTHERGYYVVWDTASWHKERRELTLQYTDLETNPAGAQVAGVPA